MNVVAVVAVIKGGGGRRLGTWAAPHLALALLYPVVDHDRHAEDDLVDAGARDRRIDVQRRGRVVLGRLGDGGDGRADLELVHGEHLPDAVQHGASSSIAQRREQQRPSALAAAARVPHQPPLVTADGHELFDLGGAEVAQLRHLDAPGYNEVCKGDGQGQDSM